MLSARTILVIATCLPGASSSSIAWVDEPGTRHVAESEATTDAGADAQPGTLSATRPPAPTNASTVPLATEGAVSAALRSGAASSTPPSQGEEHWKWRVVPYLFAANLDGDLSVGSTEVSTDVSFGDLVENLDFGGFLMFEGQHGRWGFLIDSAYIDLGEEGKGPAGISRKADATMTLLGAAGTWRVAPDSPFDLVLGLRYLDVEQELRVGPASAEGSSQVLDAIVGGRATWPLAERWRFGLYGDLGSGDSDLTWQALAHLGYDFQNWGLNLGYRVLDYDIEDGSKAVDVALEGWVIGAEFRF